MARNTVAWSDKDVSTVESMAAKGRSSGDIARHFGITRNAVIGLCTRRGIQLASNVGGTRADPAFVARLRTAVAAGKGPAEIAEAEGMTTEQVRDRVRYYGLQLAEEFRRPSRMTVVRETFGVSAAARTKARKQAVERKVAMRAVVCLATESARRVVEASGCRWPLWNADTPLSEKMVCGRQQEENGSYCPEHAMLAYRAPEDRRKAA